MVLGIDYGRKRIGLAVSDETETIAVAINPIFVKDRNKVTLALLEIIKVNRVNKILVGLPLGIGEKPTKMSNEIKGFTKVLKENARINIEFWNETSTSEIAKNNIITTRGIDSQSARIILQEYLDFNKLKNQH